MLIIIRYYDTNIYTHIRRIRYSGTRRAGACSPAPGNVYWRHRRKGMASPAGGKLWTNSIDEAVAGFAKKISVNLIDSKTIEITDDGRGIPVDEHPKYPGKSALEVILTTLHSGGKFNNNVYKTSGGLHGVGSAVVNALSLEMIVTISRDGYTWRQTFSRGKPTSAMTRGEPTKAHGTQIRFTIDDQIFGENAVFKPIKIYRIGPG